MKMGRLDFRHRLIAIFLSVSLTVYETLSYAVPLPSAPQIPEIKTPSAASFSPAFVLPENLGKIEKENVTGSELSVILIQDAHGQSSAQESMYRILKYLKETSGVRMVFLEGAAPGRISPNLLRLSKKKSVNEKTLQSLLRDGVIGGPDLFLLQNSETVRGYGVEAPDLYAQDVLIFRKVYAAKKQTETFLENLKIGLMALASETFNEDLKGFMKEWLFFQDSRRDLLTHLDFLEEKSKKFLSLDFQDPRLQGEYPQLVRFFRMQALETRMSEEDFSGRLKKEKSAWLEWTKEKGLASPEAARLQQWLSRNGSREAVPRELRRVLEAFDFEAKPSGFKWNQFPDLNLYFAHAILSQEMESEDLFAELHKVTDLLKAKLVRTPEEKKLLRLFEDYLLLKKIMSLEWTRSDYEKNAARMPRLRPSSFMKRFPALERPGLRAQARDADRIFTLAAEFYRVAVLREENMVSNVLSVLRAAGESRAVLITGGFHSEGLSAAFEKKSISHWTLLPHMDSLEVPAHYLAQMTLGRFRPRKSFSVTSPNPGRLSVPAISRSVSAEDGRFVGGQMRSALRKFDRGKPEPGPGYDMHFPRQGREQGRRSEMRVFSPWENDIRGYSMAKVMTLLAYLPRHKIPLGEYEGLKDQDFEGLLGLITQKEKKTVAPDLKSVPAKRIKTLAQNQAPPVQAIHEFTKNGSDWSLSSEGRAPVRSSQHGEGAIQLLGQLTGPGEYAVVETKMEGARGVRLIFWNTGTAEYPDYQIHYEFADGLTGGTKISVFKPMNEGEQEYYKKFLRDKIKVSASAPVFINGERGNTPEAYEYSGPAEGGKVRGDLSRVEVTVSAEGFTVQDFGTGMNLKILMESFLNPNARGNGEAAPVVRRVPQSTKVFSRSAPAAETTVEMCINGQQVQSQVLVGDRLNTAGELIVDFAPGTAAPKSWDRVEFDEKTIEGMKDAINRITDPAAQTGNTFALINAMAVLIRSIPETPGAVAVLMAHLKARTQALVAARRTAGEKIILVPNLTRTRDSSHGWSGFDVPGFTPLDPELFGFDFQEVLADGRLTPAPASFTEELAAKTPGLANVPVYLADWDYRGKTGASAGWIFVNGRPAIIMDKKLFEKTSRGLTFALLGKMSPKLPEPVFQQERTDSVVKKEVSGGWGIGTFFRNFYRHILVLLAALTLVFIFLAVRPSPPSSVDPLPAPSDKGVVVQKEMTKEEKERRDLRAQVREILEIPELGPAALDRDLENLNAMERRLNTDFIEPYLAKQKTKMTVEEASKLNDEIRALRWRWQNKHTNVFLTLTTVPGYRAPVLRAEDVVDLMGLARRFNASQKNEREWIFIRPRDGGDWEIKSRGVDRDGKNTGASVRGAFLADYVYPYSALESSMIDVRSWEREARSLAGDVKGNREAAWKQRIAAIEAGHSRSVVYKYLMEESRRLKDQEDPLARHQADAFEKIKNNFESRDGKIFYEEGNVSDVFPADGFNEKSVRSGVYPVSMSLEAGMLWILKDSAAFSRTVELKGEELRVKKAALERRQRIWVEDFERAVSENQDKPELLRELTRIGNEFNAEIARIPVLVLEDGKPARWVVKEADAPQAEVPESKKAAETRGQQNVSNVPGWLIGGLVLLAIGGFLAFLRYLYLLSTGDLTSSAPQPQADKIGSASPFGQRKQTLRPQPIVEREKQEKKVEKTEGKPGLYGTIQNPVPGGFGGMAALTIGYFFPLDEKGDWQILKSVRKTASPVAVDLAKNPIVVRLWGEVKAGQEVPLLNYPNGVIDPASVKIYPSFNNGTRLETEIEPAEGELQGENFVFKSDGTFEIEYTIHLYRPEDIQWEFSIDPRSDTMSLLPYNELGALEEHFTDYFLKTPDSDHEKLEAIRSWMKANLYYNHSSDKSRELDRKKEDASWAEALQRMTSEGDKCGVICNTAALVKVLLAAHLLMPAIYMTMVVPDGEGDLTTTRDGHAAPLIYNRIRNSAAWTYEEATTDLGPAPAPKESAPVNLGAALSALWDFFAAIFGWAASHRRAMVNFGLYFSKVNYHIMGFALTVLSPLILASIFVPSLVVIAKVALISMFSFVLIMAGAIFILGAFHSLQNGESWVEGPLKHLGIPGLHIFKAVRASYRQKSQIKRLFNELGMDSSPDSNDSIFIKFLLDRMNRRNFGTDGTFLNWARTLDPAPKRPPIRLRYLDDPEFWKALKQWKALNADYFSRRKDDAAIGDEWSNFLTSIMAAVDDNGTLWFSNVGQRGVWQPNPSIPNEPWTPASVYLNSLKLRSEMRPVIMKKAEDLLEWGIRERKVGAVIELLKFANSIIDFGMEESSQVAGRFLDLAKNDFDMAVHMMAYLSEQVYVDLSRKIPVFKSVGEDQPALVEGDEITLDVNYREGGTFDYAIVRMHRVANTWEYTVIYYRGGEIQGEDSGMVTSTGPGSPVAIRFRGNDTIIFRPGQAGTNVHGLEQLAEESQENPEIVAHDGYSQTRLLLLPGLFGGAPRISQSFTGRERIWAEWLVFGSTLEFENDEKVEGLGAGEELLGQEFSEKFNGRMSLGWMVDAARKHKASFQASQETDLTLGRVRDYILETKGDNEVPVSEQEMLAMISTQDRTRMLMIRELIQNARDAILENIDLLRARGVEPKIRIRSYLVKEGDDVYWVVGVEDPVGMDHKTFFFTFWPPRATTKSVEEMMKDILRNDQGADSQAVQVIEQLMDADAATDLEIRAWISDRIVANGDFEKTAADILTRYKTRFRKSLGAGLFGVGKDTVYADADEVLARTESGGKLFPVRIRVEHQDAEEKDKVTGLVPVSYASYDDPEGKYQGTLIQRRKKVADPAQAGFMDRQMKYLFVEYVGAVDDVPIVLVDKEGKEEKPFMDNLRKVAQAGKDYPVTVVRSRMGVVRSTVDKLLIQSQRDPRLYSGVPVWAQKWMDENALGLDFARGTPVTESRTSFLRPQEHSHDTAVAVLKALALGYREGWAEIPGIPSYEQFLKSKEFDRLPVDPAAREDAKRINRGEKLSFETWQAYAQNPARYLALLVGINTPGLSGEKSLIDEKEELYFRQLPEWVKQAFFTNESFRRAFAEESKVLEGDPVTRPEQFSNEAAEALIRVMIRLYIEGKIQVPGLPRFSEYIRPDHSLIPAGPEAERDVVFLQQGNRDSVDFSIYREQQPLLIQLILSLPLQNKRSVNQIKEEIITTAAVNAVSEQPAAPVASQEAAVRLTSRWTVTASDSPAVQAFSGFLDGFLKILDSGLTKDEKNAFSYGRLDWDLSANNWEIIGIFEKFLAGDSDAEQALLETVLSRISVDAENAGLAFYDVLIRTEYDAAALRPAQPLNLEEFRAQFRPQLEQGGHIHFEYEFGARSEMRSVEYQPFEASVEIQVEVAVYAAQRMVRPEVLGALDLELEEKLWGARKAARAEGDPAVTKLANAIMQSTRPVSAVSVVPDDLSAEEMEQYVTGILPVLNQPVSTHEVVVLVQGENTAEFKKLFEKAFNAAARKFQVTEPRQKLLQVHIVGERKFETTGDIFLQGREVLVIAPYGFKSRLLDERGALSRVMSDRLINQSPITQKNRRNLLGTFVATGFETLLFQPKEMEQDEYMAMGPGQAWYLRNESLIGDLNAFVTGLMEQTRWVAQSA